MESDLYEMVKEYLPKEEPYERIKSAKDIDTDGAIALVGAMMVSAIEEYEFALLNSDENYQKECERFFLGKYFQSLTDLNGQAIIDKVKRDLKENPPTDEDRKTKRNMYIRSQKKD